MEKSSRLLSEVADAFRQLSGLIESAALILNALIYFIAMIGFSSFCHANFANCSFVGIVMSQCPTSLQAGEMDWHSMRSFTDTGNGKCSEINMNMSRGGMPQY